MFHKGTIYFLIKKIFGIVKYITYICGMNKELILKEDTRINVISVSDKKNNNMFMSHNLNMTLNEYIGKSKQIPNILNTEMKYISSFNGMTSTGNKFKCSLYQHFGQDVDIIVGVID